MFGSARYGECVRDAMRPSLRHETVPYVGYILAWIVLFLCSILLLPLFVYAAPILKLIGQCSAVAEQTILVALWLIPLPFSFVFLFTLQGFLQCQLKTAVIAWVCGLALLVHVFTTWLFVYKLRDGLVGTAITLDFSWWLSVLGLFGYSVFCWCPVSWTDFSSQAFVGLSEFFKLSLASGIMLGLENFYYRMLIIVAGYMKNTEAAVAALSIWVRVANEIGAGNSKGARFASLISVLTSLVVGLCFWSMILAFHDNLTRIFTSSSSVIAMVNELEQLLAFTILLNCIQPVLSGVAVGYGWQAVVAFINIGSYYIIGAPVGILLGWLFHFGTKGIWTGMLSGTLVQTLLLAIITVRCNWEEEARKFRIRMANSSRASDQ